MNVASLELCKELYEVSGWGDYPDRTHFTWREFEGKTTGSNWTSPEEDYSAGWIDPFDGRRPTGITHHISHVSPAYDLAYLLRKLPPVIKDTRLYLVNFNTRGWAAMYTKTDPGTLYKKDADTPENALAQLAIELFEQKILTPGKDESDE